MLSVAVSPGLFFFNSRIALIPSGVAALPKPKRFALKFIDIQRNASLSSPTSGNNLLSSGAQSFDSFSITPLSFAILINPDHMHSMPLMDSSSSTAEPDESIIPELSSPSEPQQSEYKNDAAIIAANTYDIATSDIGTFYKSLYTS